MNNTQSSGLTARLKNYLLTNSFISNVLILSGGMGLAQGISILVSPLLTRLYKPDDFGILMVFGSLSSISLIVASLRYEAAILLPEDDERAANVLGLCFFIMLFMSLFFGLGVWIAGSFISNVTHTPALQSYLLLLPISILGAGTYHILNCWAMRKKNFKHIARTRLVQSIGQITTQVGLGLLGLGPIGLLLGFIVGQVSGSGTLAVLAWRQNKSAFKQISIPGIIWAMKRYRRFPLLSSGPALLNGMGLQLPVLMLAFLYGANVTGLFSLSQRVLGVPVALLGASVAQVFFAEAANLAKKSPQKVERLLTKSLINMFLIGLPVTVLIALGAPGIFPIIFGPEWEEAGIYLRSLSLMFLMQFVSNSVGSIIDVLERQDIHLLREVTRVSLILGTIFLANHFQANPTTAVMLFSIAASAGYGFSIFLSWYAIKNVRNVYDKS